MHSPKQGTRKSVSRTAKPAFACHIPSSPNVPSAVDIKDIGTLSGVELSSRVGLFPMISQSNYICATSLLRKDSFLERLQIIFHVSLLILSRDDMSISGLLIHDRIHNLVVHRVYHSGPANDLNQSYF